MHLFRPNCHRFEQIELNSCIILAFVRIHWMQWRKLQVKINIKLINQMYWTLPSAKNAKCILSSINFAHTKKYSFKIKQLMGWIESFFSPETITTMTQFWPNIEYGKYTFVGSAQVDNVLHLNDQYRIYFSHKNKYKTVKIIFLTVKIGCHSRTVNKTEYFEHNINRRKKETT